MSDLNEFNKNGFIIKKQLFTDDEIKKLINFINSNSDKENQSRKTRSSTGNLNLTIWNHPSDDLFGKFSTNERIVKPMENFLGDEVYHYHSKIIWKKPGDGGFDWHQDYGYWYHNACLYPDMASCFIMLDKACIRQIFCLYETLNGLKITLSGKQQFVSLSNVLKIFITAYMVYG